jgi:hypothetical protein
LGPVDDVTTYGEGAGERPFDADDPREVMLRGPGFWLAAVRTPTFVVEGDTAPSNAAALIGMAVRPSAPPAARFFTVKGTHFSYLAALNKLLAAKINRDVGPATNLALGDGELPGLKRVARSPELASLPGADVPPPPAGPVTATVTAEPATEPAARVTIDRLAWELSNDHPTAADVARYNGKYVELRGAVGEVRATSVRVQSPAGAGGQVSALALACELAPDPVQLAVASELSLGQEVVVCGTMRFTGGKFFDLRDCRVTAVGPDVAVRTTVDALRKAFAASAAAANAQYRGKTLVIDGTLRSVDAGKYQALIDGTPPNAAAAPVRALVGAAGIEAVKRHAPGDPIRIKGRLLEFRDNQFLLELAREVAIRPTPAATKTP